MKGFRFFPIHILIKDLSFLVFYWLLIKYVFTEINNPSVTSESSLWDIIYGAFFYNMATLILSLILYFPIVYGIKKIKLNVNFELILTGLLLTLTTPIFYFFLKDWNHNDYYELKPELIAWVLCFIVSVGFYYLVNKLTLKSTE